jgi:predicted kinase
MPNKNGNVNSPEKECSVKSQENKRQGQIEMVTKGVDYFALLKYQEIRHLEGKILTLVDATYSDKTQREAVKCLFRQMVWFDWAKNLESKNWNCDSVPAGIPREDA